MLEFMEDRWKMTAVVVIATLLILAAIGYFSGYWSAQ